MHDTILVRVQYLLDHNRDYGVKCSYSIETEYRIETFSTPFEPNEKLGIYFSRNALVSGNWHVQFVRHRIR